MRQDTIQKQWGFVFKIDILYTVVEGGFTLGYEPGNPLDDRDIMSTSQLAMDTWHVAWRWLGTWLVSTCVTTNNNVYPNQGFFIKNNLVSG